MPDRLRFLVKTIVGSLPVKDPHTQQRQQRSIIDPHPIHHTKPFSPSDHVGPQPIIKEQVREDAIPPAMVCSCLVLPVLVDPMEGSLGDLSNFSSAFPSRRKRRERLPLESLDNVPIQTMGYTLRC